MKPICQDIPATLAALGGGSFNSFSDGFDLLPSLLDGEPWPRFQFLSQRLIILSELKSNIMSYSKDIACIDVQRRSLLLFGDKSHYGCFEDDGCRFDGNYEMSAQNVRLIFSEMI